MNFNEYQKLALRTARKDQPIREALLNGVLGLMGEAGEVTDLIKKHAFQDHELDISKITEELGDVLWYVALIAKSLGADLGDVARGNIDKLEKRYPTGVFRREDSVNRSKNLPVLESQRIYPADTVGLFDGKKIKVIEENINIPGCLNCCFAGSEVCARFLTPLCYGVYFMEVE